MHSVDERVNEVVAEVENRASVRRASDRWLIGLLAMAVVAIFGAGSAWQSAKAQSGQKLDKTEFTDFVATYTKNRTIDSLIQANRDSAIAKFSRKQDKIACKLHVEDCE